MNTYKKTVIASGIALLAFQASYATPAFDKAKSQLDTAFKALFDPMPDKFSFMTFKKDERAPIKLTNFNAAIKTVEQFVKTNNKGLILGASTALDQASKTLVVETVKLITILNDMRKRLIEKGNFATEQWGSQSEIERSITGAQQFHIELVNIRDRIKPIRDALRVKVDDYKSTGQKEAYALLVDALQDIHDAIEIVRNQFIVGGWLKK